MSLPTHFDSMRDFAAIQCDFDLDGLLVHALAKVHVFFPTAAVSLIAFFSLDDDGSPRFTDAASIPFESPAENFVMAFHVPGSDFARTFWYVRQFFDETDTPYESPFGSFLSRLAFGTTLLKAVPISLFFDDFFTSEKARAAIVVPTKRNMAAVISDMRRTHSLSEPDRVDGVSPGTPLDLAGEAKLTFGYSNIGGRIYFGTHADLHHTMKPHSALWRFIKHCGRKARSRIADVW